MRRLWTSSLIALLAACPGAPSPDAGPADAGLDAGGPLPGPACTTSKDCRLARFDGACRAGTCTAAALCADDVECALGENCLTGACRFTGCAENSDCASGRCRLDVFACAECGASSDCPSTRPVCDSSNKCVSCVSDAQCGPPGPGHCDAPSGACVHCLEDKHCPNGLYCGAGHVCAGVKQNGACPKGTACDSGLTCVGIGGTNLCLPSCPLYAPTCKSGEVCYKLTFSGGSGLVFDQGGPLGVCYAAQPNAKGYREACTRPAASASTSNCQPNLACVPDSPTLSLCRTYCDLNLLGACPAGEQCHPLKGDANGRLYGLCYPDNGWGGPCARDSACAANQSCVPFEDPSAPEDLSPVCQFSVGTAPGLAPCANTPLPDAGLLLADRVCQSGACLADPLASSAKFFCYAACKADSDCSVAGRTGTCDGEFSFPAGAVPGKAKGCRRRCASATDCGEYGAGVVCRGRYDAGYNPSFFTTCAPAAGPRGPGAACTAHTQCRSGFCLRDDGRGVARAGYCAEPCGTAADCAGDGGSSTGPLECARTSFLGFQGWDSAPGTTDDVLLTARVCAGRGCSVDEDCGVDAGVRCVPDVEQRDGGPGLALRCRPPHATGISSGAAACSADWDCASGVCGTLQAPSTGTGKACFHACTAATACPGGSTCRVGGMRVATTAGSVSFDSCAP